MPVLNRRIDTAQIATIAAGLDREGFVCVEGIVDQEWLNRALAHVMALIGVEGQRWFVVIRPGDTPGTPPFEFVQHPDIVALMDGLAEHARPAAFIPGESVYSVLRVVAGGETGGSAPKMHYDATSVTMLVPVIIPPADGGHSGELVIYPNNRPYRTFVLANIIEKIFLQSGWAQRRTARRLAAGDRSEVTDLKVGNLYLFYGYRSYHGNFGVAPDRVRSSLLLHHGDPHGRSLLLRGVLGLRRWRENRRLAHRPST